VAERPRLDALMGKQAFLAVDQPLDLGVTLGSGQSFRWRLNDDGAWTGVLGHDMVRLRAVEGGLLVESGPTPPEKLTDALAAYLRLDDDLPAIQRHLAEDGRVGEAIAAYPGLRVLRQDPWETLAAFILSQNSNIPRIAGTIEAIAQRFGDPVEQMGASGHTFPSPVRLAEAGEKALRELGCGYRAPYLSGAAAMVASGEVRLDRLRRASYQEAQEALLAILGVGEKVADCVMLFALDQMDAFPVDRWIRRALEEWYAPGIAMTYPQARAWALEQFGPLAGYANQYLFWGRRQGQGATLPS
jgi:N-glycosylase/DNA lyase